MYKRRKTTNFFDIWPAYVDILATVLMVLIFVLMTFVIAQIYLSDSITNKDTLIDTLNNKLSTIDYNLTSEKKRHDAAVKLVEKLESDLQLEKNNGLKTESEKIKISKNLETFITTVNKLEKSLEEESQNHKKDKDNLDDLKDTLLSLEKKLQSISVENEELTDENAKHKALNRVHAYRSEFFDQLKSAVGDYDGIKVVGDRFIFQSELLFEVGSADLEDEGQKQLKRLSQTLKNIAKKIPEDVNWILRVDGHTDKRPIKSSFPSNWELSSARAIAVVKFLISDGIAPKRLVAAGFGEYQPLVQDKEADEKALARNRRIEFKLDQR